MCPDIMHAWSCDEEHFEDDAALARHLAARIEDGENHISFSREGCWFRLDYEDREYPATMTPPADAFSRSRTYSVILVTNSPNCRGGNVFTATWPDGYTHGPVQVVARDAPPDARIIPDGTVSDVLHVLTGIAVVLGRSQRPLARPSRGDTPGSAAFVGSSHRVIRTATTALTASVVATRCASRPGCVRIGESQHTVPVWRNW